MAERGPSKSDDEDTHLEAEVERFLSPEQFAPDPDVQTAPRSPAAIGEINDGIRVKVLLELLGEDKVVETLEDNIWPDVRIVAAVAAGGCSDGEIVKLLVMDCNDPWEYDRTITAFSAAGFADARIVKMFREDIGTDDRDLMNGLGDAGWNDARLIAALGEVGMNDCEIVEILSEANWEIEETLQNAGWDGQRITSAMQAAGVDENRDEDEENEPETDGVPETVQVTPTPTQKNAVAKILARCGNFFRDVWQGRL